MTVPCVWHDVVESVHDCAMCVTWRCRICTWLCYDDTPYGVATISSLLEIIGLFCKKEPWKRDYILQKRPITLRSLLIVATPYRIWTSRFTHASVMLHLNESCHIWISHVTFESHTNGSRHANESCHTTEESRHASAWRHVTNESRHAVMSHWFTWHTSNSFHSRTSHTIHD